jgi:hypothetical protein
VVCCGCFVWPLLGITGGSGWDGSIIWAVWCSKQRAVDAAAGPFVVVVLAGTSRLMGARSSRTERSSALLMAGGLADGQLSELKERKVLFRRRPRCSVRSRLRESLGIGRAKFSGLDEDVRSARRNKVDPHLNTR